ncbi:MAG: putative leader peptide [Actinocrinis sp.]
MRSVLTGQVVTGVASLVNIGYVLSRIAWLPPQGGIPGIRRGRTAVLASVANLLLTKRRAVDFCRVATAICS